MTQSQLEQAILNFGNYIEARHERVDRTKIETDIQMDGIILRYFGVYKSYTAKVDMKSDTLISDIDVKEDPSKMSFEPIDND